MQRSLTVVLFIALSALLPMTAAAQIFTTPLLASRVIEAGDVSIWEDGDAVVVYVETSGDWLLRKLQVYFGEEMFPLRDNGNPKVGRFPFKKFYVEDPVSYSMVTIEEQCPLTLSEDATRIVAVHADLLNTVTLATVGAWALGPYEFEGPRWGWWNEYDLSCSPPLQR